MGPHRLPLQEDRSGPLWIVGAEEDGVELEIEVRGAEPLVLEAAEIRHGLPDSVRDQAPPRPRHWLPRGQGDLSVFAFTVEL